MNTKQRSAVVLLTFSAMGLVKLASDEAFTPVAIIPTKGDRPTVGLGSTFRDDGTPVQMGDRITVPQALKRTLAHIQKDETALKRCVTAPLTQVEFDTLVNHEYQYGSAATCSSPMVKSVNSYDYAGACKGYLSYRYITSTSAQGAGWVPYQIDTQGRPTRWRFDCSVPGNKVCSGVWARSQDRYNACMGEQE